MQWTEPRFQLVIVGKHFNSPRLSFPFQMGVIKPDLAGLRVSANVY